jgi:hypothetical protein
LKITARTEYADPIAIQNRQLAVHIAEPHTAKAIVERNHYAPCLWEIVAATERRPTAIGYSPGHRIVDTYRCVFMPTLS